MSIPVGTNWRQCFMDNIGHASLVILLISKSIMETFKDNGEPDNVLLEWDVSICCLLLEVLDLNLFLKIAVAKRKRGEVEILPVFLLEPGEDGFDFKGIAKHQTVSKDCSLSFEELWSAISEIQGIQIHFSGEYDLEALEGRINKLVSINKVVSTRIEAEKTVYSRQVKNPHGFVGREDILCAISAHFSNCNESAAVLLYGGPGMGKTTIVTKFAYTLKSASDSRYTHIFWISLVSRYSFQTSIKDLLGS
ncbi:hypothetical protein HK098_008145 [Nowakowskiella sp. JEL0407]|nr:hypothetical protein HK098_008145 [Nowakowskiella sp. JEL0407]